MMMIKMNNLYKNYNKEIKPVHREINQQSADRRLTKAEEEQLATLINHNLLTMIQRGLLLNKMMIMMKMKIPYKIQKIQIC